MDFLDQLIDPIYSNNSDLKETTRRRLEYMIAAALITPEEKLWLEHKSINPTEKEAQEIITILSNMMPIMGLHSTPHSLKEKKEARDYLIAKDDAHELRKNKNGAKS